MKGAAASWAVAAALGAGTCDAAETYCTDPAGYVKVYVDRQAMKRKLLAGGYADVEAFYTGLQRAYESGSRSDAHLAAWFVAFQDADPRVKGAAQEWMKRYPDSYAARRALAGHWYEVAWQRRGDRYSDDTNDAQFIGMRAALLAMLDVLDGADRLTARPIASFPLRINAAAMLGRPASVRELFEGAEKLDIRNTEAKAAFMQMSSPKWGGPKGALDDVIERVKEIRPPSEDLIRYMGYHASWVVGDLFDSAGKYAEAIGQYERAAANCSAYVAPLERLVRLYKATGKPELARGAAARARDLYQQAFDSGDTSLKPHLERLRREAQ